jgi:hypothetical protein
MGPRQAERSKKEPKNCVFSNRGKNKFLGRAGCHIFRTHKRLCGNANLDLLQYYDNRLKYLTFIQSEQTIHMVFFIIMGRANMKSAAILFSVIAACAVPAAAQSIVVVTAPQIGQDQLPVAYAELASRQNTRAVEKLSIEDGHAQHPAHLINLGTALARTGQIEAAKSAYVAALNSPQRYDLEMANGSYRDSRWAARTALAQLNSRQARSGGQLALNK